jgi:hypothetical protein
MTEILELKSEKSIAEQFNDEFAMYEGAGTWHGKHRLTVKPGCNITVCGMITGCGLGQIHGLTNLVYNKVTKEELINVLQSSVKNGEIFKSGGLGAFIGTLGAFYIKDYEQAVLELGFKKLISYPNYRHNKEGLEFQSCYMLII